MSLFMSLTSGSEACSVFVMRLVMLGAPGSGKGTQSKQLVAKRHIPQISSGDLLREAVAAGTELGLKAKSAMDAGELVTDEIVLGLIRERLEEPDTDGGFILDGFPRNLTQAHDLDTLLEELGQPLDRVIFLDVDHDTLMKRLTGRRTCIECGRLFNIYFAPPGTPPHCEICNDMPRLQQRDDDNEETIANRLRVYRSQTEPLIEHYRQKGQLRVVEGSGEIGEVFERLESELQ